MKKIVRSAEMPWWKLGVAARMAFLMNFSRCTPVKVLGSMETLGCWKSNSLKVQLGSYAYQHLPTLTRESTPFLKLQVWKGCQHCQVNARSEALINHLFYIIYP